MAITAQNLSFVGVGPTKSGQIVAHRSDVAKRHLEGYCTFTLDGALSTATINLIDGTQTLPFTPTLVSCAVAGGDQQATAYIGANISTWDATTATVVFSGAGTAAKTIKLRVVITE